MAPTAAGAARRPGRARAQATPARFMQPRIVLIAVVCVLVAFGLLMIYSASSVKALQASGDAAYYLKRQALMAALGLAAAVVLARSDYHVWTRMYLPLCAITLVLLMLTAAAGQTTKGAVRWIEIAGIGIQPSELSKITIILGAAGLFQRYYEERSIDAAHLALGLGLAAVSQLALILLQPDKGTTAIIVATLVVMAILSGVSRRAVIAVGALGAVVVLVLALSDSYSLSRILTVLNPDADPDGSGYQLRQGLYAFANGGLLGRGVGLSRQKYSYLPEAHNDFIFAVIGEECGLVGTLAVVALFGLLVWTCMRVARYAPDLSGRLIAAGVGTLLGIQFLVNVCGILGITPMTGKPLPFLSYGGSSLVACLMMVGLVISVSRASALPETVHDRRRAQLGVADAPAQGRPERYDGGGRPRGLRLVSGGAPATRRIDLGAGAYERLRPTPGGRQDRRPGGGGGTPRPRGR